MSTYLPAQGRSRRGEKAKLGLRFQREKLLGKKPNGAGPRKKDKKIKKVPSSDHKEPKKACTKGRGKGLRRSGISTSKHFTGKEKRQTENGHHSRGGAGGKPYERGRRSGGSGGRPKL